MTNNCTFRSKILPVSFKNHLHVKHPLFLSQLTHKIKHDGNIIDCNIKRHTFGISIAKFFTSFSPTVNSIKAHKTHTKNSQHTISCFKYSV